MKFDDEIRKEILNNIQPDVALVHKVLNKNGRRRQRRVGYYRIILTLVLLFIVPVTLYFQSRYRDKTKYIVDEFPRNEIVSLPVDDKWFDAVSIYRLISKQDFLNQFHDIDLSDELYENALFYDVNPYFDLSTPHNELVLRINEGEELVTVQISTSKFLINNMVGKNLLEDAVYTDINTARIYVFGDDDAMTSLLIKTKRYYYTILIGSKSQEIVQPLVESILKEE